MIQLFIQISKINEAIWADAYKRIESIVQSFPLKLLRVESFNRYSNNLDKDHLDLYIDKDTINEHLSFYGDWTSFSYGNSIKFYKNWQKHIELATNKKQDNSDKSIFWTPYIPFKNDGSLPEANGAGTPYGYLETNGTCYEYAIIAIGIMLENLMPNAAFVIASEQKNETINPIIDWLENHFKEPFNSPIYFDRIKLLNVLSNEYENKSHLVCRIEHIYRKQYFRNIQFALEHIGYEPTFNFYAEILSDNTFGTFGFSDVLDPWIAASQDLESTLALIAQSKKISLQRDGKLYKEYDLSSTLKQLLNEFILWTPLQREQLDHFPTNKEALETGSEDLWGTLRRMAGKRVDICPMYATQDELFEAFMYHEPSQGAVFKQIIDDWIEKNVDSFDKLKTALSEKYSEYENVTEPSEVSENVEDYFSEDAFIASYQQYDQFFINQALIINPGYAKIDEGISSFYEKIQNLREAKENHSFVEDVDRLSKELKISNIKSRLRKVELCVCKDFEKWLQEENDDNVMSNLYILLALKLYDRQSHYIRYRILWDRKYWNIWRKRTE